MAEIDAFSSSMTQEQQTEYLKSINQSMTRLVDVTERDRHSTSQFFQGNAVQSTVANLKDISQGAYDRFSYDFVETKDSLRSTAHRFTESGHTFVGTAKELASHVPSIQPLAPVSTVGFFGASPGYMTNYRSTFWNDLWGGYLGDRAPQPMFQSDFQQIARENMGMRGSMLSPLRAGANLLGVDTGIDNAAVDDIISMSQRYQRFGSSTAIGGIGTSRGHAIQLIESERMKLLDQIGYTQNDFNAARQTFAAGGQFIGTRNEIERSNMTFQGMDVAEKMAKVLAVPIQDAARAMMEVRQQMGVTSFAGQAQMLMQTQALGMASGLNFQEIMSGMASGGQVARQLGFNVKTGSVIGRDVLAASNAAYLDSAIGESLVQSAGGIQNLSQNLATSAINFASGPGSMYYMASMQGNQFSQNAFNQATGGFGQLGAMAASNVSTIQGYANFIANKDNIQAQGGSFNVMAMQRAHMNNIFKSATGRDYDSSSTEDTNMMKMLASSSGMFTDPTTAKAFVEMNFTEAGSESLYATQRDAYRAEQNLKMKTFIDQRFKSTSTDQLGRDIENIWNKPVQGIRGWFNKAFTDVGERNLAEDQLAWASGNAGLGRLTGEEVSSFANAGGFSNNITYGPTVSSEQINSAFNQSSTFGRTLTGMYSGGKVGFAVGGAAMTLITAGALASGSGFGAIVGVPAMIAGGVMLASGVGGVVAGGAYGALTGPEAFMVPGLAQIAADKDRLAGHDKTVAAWNRGGGFSVAEKNTMGDPDFQKRALKALMDKGLAGTFKVTPQNQIEVAAKVQEVAKELGVSESMVAQIAQTKGGMKGDMLFGSELAWATTGALDMATATKELDENLQDVFDTDTSFKEMIKDSGFSTKLGALLGSTGDASERQQLAAQFFAKYGDTIEGGTRDKLEQYVKTGAFADKSILGERLTQYGRNIQNQKVKESISSMFGARAKEDRFASVADEFEAIANASSPSEQVKMVQQRMGDETFRKAIEGDPSLKRLLPLEGPIDQSMLADANAFKQRFKQNPTDDLKDLQKLLESGGEEAVRSRMIGGVIAQSAKSDQFAQKQNEAEMLEKAANTFKEVAVIVQQIKGK